MIVTPCRRFGHSGHCAWSSGPATAWRPSGPTRLTGSPPTYVYGEWNWSAGSDARHRAIATSSYRAVVVPVQPVGVGQFLSVVELFVRGAAPSQVRDLETVGIIRCLLHDTLPVRLREHPRVSEMIVERVRVRQLVAALVISDPPAWPKGSSASSFTPLPSASRYVKLLTKQTTDTFVN